MDDEKVDDFLDKVASGEVDVSDGSSTNDVQETQEIRAVERIMPDTDPISDYSKFLSTMNGFGVNYYTSIIAKMVPGVIVGQIQNSRVRDSYSNMPAKSSVTNSDKTAEYLHDIVLALEHLSQDHKDDAALDLLEELSLTISSDIGTRDIQDFLGQVIDQYYDSVKDLKETYGDIAALLQRAAFTTKGLEVRFFGISVDKDYETMDVKLSLRASCLHNAEALYSRLDKIKTSFLIDTFKNLRLVSSFLKSLIGTEWFKTRMSEKSLTAIRNGQQLAEFAKLEALGADVLKMKSSRWTRWIKNRYVPGQIDSFAKLMSKIRSGTPYLMRNTFKAANSVIEAITPFMGKTLIAVSNIAEVLNAWYSATDAIEESSVFMYDEDIRSQILSVVSSGSDISAEDANEMIDFLTRGFVSERSRFKAKTQFLAYAKGFNVPGYTGVANDNIPDPVVAAAYPNAYKVLNLIDYLNEEGDALPLFAAINVMDCACSCISVIAGTSTLLTTLGKFPAVAKLLEYAPTAVKLGGRSLVILNVAFIAMDVIEKYAEHYIVTEGFVETMKDLEFSFAKVKEDSDDDQAINNSTNWY